MIGKLIKSALATAMSASAHARDNASDGGTSALETEAAGDARIYNAGFATISIPQNWRVSKSHTTSKLVVLVQNGSSEHGSVVDNIQMTYGTCPYSADEAIDFGHAILSQFDMRGTNASSITANGSTRADGVNVLQFRVVAPEAVYTQYYVMGDREFVRLNALNFTDDPNNKNTLTNIDEAVQVVVNSCVITKK